MSNVKTPLCELSAPAQAWASKRRRQGLSPTQLKDLLSKQKELCALSKARLLFDREQGTPQKDGHGVHPLYPAVDHIESGSGERDHQIVCYALNDVKGHMPFDCFKAMQRTKPWKALMERWRSLAENDPCNREKFTKLIFPNGNRRK